MEQYCPRTGGCLCMCARIKHQTSIIIKPHFISPSAQRSKDLENVGKEAQCEVVTASESRRAFRCVDFRSREVGRTGKIVPRYSGAKTWPHRPAGRLMTVYRSEAVKQAQHASASWALSHWHKMGATHTRNRFNGRAGERARDYLLEDSLMCC